MAAASNSRVLRVIPLLIALCFVNLPAYAKYSGGTGEPNDPYQIATHEDLIALGESPEDYGKHFILTADIDLDPNLPGRKVFDTAVIGREIPFVGVFDGNNHAISHLTISGDDYLGLFGRTDDGAMISNLALEAVVVSGTGVFVGGLVGDNRGTVTSCHSTGSVSGDGGWFWSSGGVGGLVGTNEGGRITTSYSSGDVGGIAHVGGLVGENGGGVADCYSTSTVRGDVSVGGLVGSNAVWWSAFGYSFFTGGVITRCHSTGLVIGKEEVGGLVGANYGSIAVSYSTNAVSGTEDVGGLVGANGGELSDCYSKSTVIGDRGVGGLVGWNEAPMSSGGVGFGIAGLIVRCYSTGTVTGTSSVGGLVGGGPWGEDPADRISSSFWDIETSGQSWSAGGAGKTTIEMQNIEIYQNAGWDLTGEIENGIHETWQVPEEGGYPVLTAFSVYASPELQGQGTLEDRYLIFDVLDLGAIIHYSRSAHYRLAASIDLSDIHWNTSVIPRLKGAFDGNGHAIRNLNIQGTKYLGFFGQLGSGSQVKSLGIVDCNIVGAGDYVGGLTGNNSGTVTRCFCTGLVGGNEKVGGLVGSNSGNMISCYSTNSVTGEGKVGGLAGNNVGILTDCNSACKVSGTRDHIGGLIGYNSGDIAASYSTGPVTGNSRVGGLVGYGDYSSSIARSYSTSSVSGTENIGGLVGHHRGTILASHSTGSVSGNRGYIGGLVGCNRGSVTQCYNIGSVIGISCVGGLVGFNYERPGDVVNNTITTSYSTGSVGGNEKVGGLVGYNRGSVTRCYSTGSVRGSEDIGGLVGSNTFAYGDDGFVTLSFWDVQSSGQAESDGGTGKTMTEMQTASTFLESGWDFVGQSDGPHDIWAEPEGGGYPILAWQLPPGGFDLPTFSGGTGEPDDPYLISTAQELNNIGHNARLMNCHFTLVQSLDLMGVQFYPIGDPAFPYTGVFNGNDQTVSHLTITGESNLGLFAALGAEAAITDLGVLDVNIAGSGSAIGGLVGSNGDYSTGEGGLVLNCYSSGSVCGESSVGGLVGDNFGSITTSHSSGSVCGEVAVGGLVGDNNLGGSILMSYSKSTITGYSFVGGLVGWNSTCTLMQCYSTGAVDGNDYVGGLVGTTESVSDAKALECFWDIETSGQATSAGGIGLTTAEMQNASTFLQAGWDFIDETANGTEDIWWILEGQDYPRLWWELIAEN